MRLATDPVGTATVESPVGTDHAVSVSGAPVALTFTGGATGMADDRRVDVNEIEDLTPTLGSVAAQTYRAGQAVSVRLPRATGGNPPVEHALTGPLPDTEGLSLPAGLSFDAATRRLRGTPEMAATYTLTATGTPVLTFVVTPALAAGLTYEPPVRNARTSLYPHGGRIAGTPEARPQRQYRLTVVDADNNEAQVTFALATGAPPAPTDRKPSFGDATVEAQRYTVGTAVTLALPAAVHPTTTYTLTATDGDGDTAPLAFTLEVVAHRCG